MMVNALILYQYGVDPERLLGDYLVSRSRKTGRVRYIGSNGKLLATIRATDGLLVPAPPLTERLAALSDYRVKVNEEAAPYVGKGRTVFAKHVVEAGRSVRPGDEVVVVDPEMRPIALGKATLPGPDMVASRRGRAVKTRKGLL